MHLVTGWNLLCRKEITIRLEKCFSVFHTPPKHFPQTSNGCHQIIPVILFCWWICLVSLITAISSKSPDNYVRIMINAFNEYVAEILVPSVWRWSTFRNSVSWHHSVISSQAADMGWLSKCIYTKFVWYGIYHSIHIE